MNISKERLISTGLGLTIGNFLYQAIDSTHNWGVAFDRSFFQIVALLILAYLAWSDSK